MISMKLKEVLAATPAIFRVLATKVPAKAAHRLAKIGKKLQAEVIDYNETRVKLVKDLGEQQANGDWKVKEENLKAFESQHNELLDADVKVDLEPLKVSELGDKVELAPADLMDCDRLIVEG